LGTLPVSRAVSSIEGRRRRGRHQIVANLAATDPVRLTKFYEEAQFALAGIEPGSLRTSTRKTFQLQAKIPRNIAMLKERLAELNSRLGLTNEK
jgi:hypothetical protein